MGYFFLIAALILKTFPFYKRSVERVALGMQYFPQIEGLRGILALSVFIVHSVSWYFMLQGQPFHLPTSGFYAQLATAPVTMFFFITGFLFWSKLQ
jgi:peptidoglycan/LPS O-acetylase OafA/YrhL